MTRPSPRSTLFPYTTLFRSYSFNPSYSLQLKSGYAKIFGSYATSFIAPNLSQLFGFFGANPNLEPEENLTKEIGDRKSTRLNSSHVKISYAVFCLKKQNN